MVTKEITTDRAQLYAAYKNEMLSRGVQEPAATVWADTKIDKLCDYAKENGLDAGLVHAEDVAKQDAAHLNQLKGYLLTDTPDTGSGGSVSTGSNVDNRPHYDQQNSYGM